jgi:hypothetical protein
MMKDIKAMFFIPLPRFICNLLKKKEKKAS